MKLLRIGPIGEERPCILVDDGLEDVSEDSSVIDVSDYISDYDAAFFGDPALQRAAEALRHDVDRARPIGGQRIGAPIARPGKIVCVGLNYADHAAESGAEPPSEPIIFFKAPNTVVGPYDDVLIPVGGAKTDWEVELGVVIGRTARYRPTVDAAAECVAGYVVSNDLSERAFQLERGGQWVKGKSCETFNPLGPWLVTPDEAGDPQHLRMWLDVNGERMQDSSTTQMLFGVHHLVWYLSQFMVLEPGDLINTGTPAGVGLGLQPPRYLRTGEVLELGIEGLGSQRQVCRQAVSDEAPSPGRVDASGGAAVTPTMRATSGSDERFALGRLGEVPTYAAVPAARARAELGESPLWDSGAGLRWLDITGRRLFTLGDDGVRTTLLSTTVTCVELGPGRRLRAVTSRGFGWLNPTSGHVEEALTVLPNGTVSMNDGGIDPHGRCWAGSAVRDGSRRGVLYRLDGVSVTRHAENIGMSNGIDWSPAGDVLYHVDSTAGTVTAWEYDLIQGELGEPRVLREVPESTGLPDGLTVDEDGNIWVAVWGAGQVWRLDPGTGETTGVVDVPTPYVTSCVFGGSDLSTLYVTTANHEQPRGGGLLYTAELPVRGRQPHRFAGSNHDG